MPEESSGAGHSIGPGQDIDALRAFIRRQWRRDLGIMGGAMAVAAGVSMAVQSLPFTIASLLLLGLMLAWFRLRLAVLPDMSDEAARRLAADLDRWSLW